MLKNHFALPVFVSFVGLPALLGAALTSAPLIQESRLVSRFLGLFGAAAVGLALALFSQKLLRVPEDASPQPRHRYIAVLQAMAIFAGYLVAMLGLLRFGIAARGTGGEPILGAIALAMGFPALVLQQSLAPGRSKGKDTNQDLSSFAALSVTAHMLGAIGLCGIGFQVRLFGLESWIFEALGWAGYVLLALAHLEQAWRIFLLIFIGGALRGMVFRSLTASMIFAGANPLATIRKDLREKFGIDLKETWSFRFMAAASPVILLFLILCAWAATGLTALGIQERGVYERFGQVGGVLGPGLHLHLPWPMGRVRRLEYGLDTRVFLGTYEEEKSSAPQPEDLDVESPATPRDDRLWESAHGREILFLSAASPVFTIDGGQERRGVRSFELISTDVVIHYRVGDKDTDAISAAYRMEDVHDLVQRQARRFFQSVSATKTPEELIEADREEWSAHMQQSLQAAMDELNSGISITLVLFEAIHPPIEAAVSFYDVQAGARDAESMVSFTKAKGNQITASAEVQAASTRDTARAQASEILSAARQDAEHFIARSASASVSPFVFRLEMLLSTMMEARKASRLLVLDHRLRNRMDDRLDLSVAWDDSATAPRTVPAGD